MHTLLTWATGARHLLPTSPLGVGKVISKSCRHFHDFTEKCNGMDLLAYWKAVQAKWPALAKMVKKYLAAPASSAGVERVFSAAGKMHDDLRKSAKDDTLKHALFAAFNTK